MSNNHEIVTRGPSDLDSPKRSKQEAADLIKDVITSDSAQSADEIVLKDNRRTSQLSAEIKVDY